MLNISGYLFDVQPKEEGFFSPISQNSKNLSNDFSCICRWFFLPPKKSIYSEQTHITTPKIASSFYTRSSSVFVSKHTEFN